MSITFQSGNNGLVMYALNCDWTGGDIGSTLDTGAECGLDCVNFSGCTHFTWSSYNGGTCWFKNNNVVGNAFYSSSAAVCGYTVAGQVAVPPVNQTLNPLVYITPRSWEDSLALAQSVVSQLTLEQKVALGSGLGWENINTPCVGQISNISSVGFPGLCLQDSPTGIRFAHNISAFPASINVAATWDTQLMYDNGRYMGEEARDKGVTTHLAPVANMMRTPQGGRIWEAQGADPFLTGVSVTNIINGVQSNGVQSTLKHFVANDQEAFRNSDPDHGDSFVDKKTLMEYYVRPFKMAIDNAGPGAIMCSYNQLNGLNACQNPAVMAILKDELKYEGYVMSDWWATGYGLPEISGPNSGLDMVMPGTQACCSSSLDQPFWWGATLVNDTIAGLVNVSRVDDLATRILTSWFRVRQDADFPVNNATNVNFNSWTPATEELNVQRNHAAHIRAVGAASSVLLKNDGVLPLTSKLTSITLIGSDAIYPPDGPNAGSDHGIAPSGTLAQGWGSGTTIFPYLIAPQDAIESVAAGLNIKVTNSSNNWDVEAATAAAAAADVSIVFGNSDSGEGYITVANFPGDRLNLTLWNNVDALVEAAASQGPTIVVIHSPGAVNMPWINHPNVSAVIMAFFPGQESGNSITDVLFGAVNPSGRLPFTIGHNDDDYVTRINFTDPNVTYSEGGYFDYRWNQKYNITPLFPFGHGLSYTTFTYANIAASAPSCTSSVNVTLDVTNSGSVDGHEVVQVYLAYPSSVTDEPAQQLKGFTRVLIAAGATQAVNIEITQDDIAVYDVATSSWVVPTGTYTVYVGASSADIRGTASFDSGPGCEVATTETSASSATSSATASASASGSATSSGSVSATGSVVVSSSVGYIAPSTIGSVVSNPGNLYSDAKSISFAGLAVVAVVMLM
ncbi:hypothetical protein HK100_007158 [Physocladia obscura]|uniref:Probable beta-glucosidase G n=1 Tax=Physocladia obscura TaxID=109957 RepID=A0AAD5XIS3_9FUNG|nr:hypothetical protein HK100_007158 [Physocladia obscura]